MSRLLNDPEGPIISRKGIGIVASLSINFSCRLPRLRSSVANVVAAMGAVVHYHQLDRRTKYRPMRRPTNEGGLVGYVDAILRSETASELQPEMPCCAI